MAVRLNVLDQFQLFPACQTLNLGFALTGLGLISYGFLIYKVNRCFVLGVKSALFSVMLFEAAGDIRSNAGVQRLIATFYYVERPGHGKFRVGNLCTWLTAFAKCHFSCKKI